MYLIEFGEKSTLFEKNDETTSHESNGRVSKFDIYIRLPDEAKWKERRGNLNVKLKRECTKKR